MPMLYAIKKEILRLINMEFRKTFKINRVEDGFVVSAKFYAFYLVPFYATCPTIFGSFQDCLSFIKSWCCTRNIGKVCILDPDGPNKEICLNYRQYKGQDLTKPLAFR